MNVEKVEKIEKVEKVEKENTSSAREMEDDLEEDDIIQENQFLTFEIAEEIYGINILSVVEIIRLLKITKIPESLSFIKGIINLRGKIIPVMDVRLRFSLDEREYDDRTCIVVVSIKGIDMGLIVDCVSEVIEIPETNIEAMPSLGGAGYQRFVKGIGKTEEGVKILLDLDKLLHDEELERIKNI